jgi:hypothetical protein
MIAGAIILISGHIIGIYVLAVAMILNIPFFISGAWLLMVGVDQDRPRRMRRRPLHFGEKEGIHTEAPPDVKQP